MVIDDDTTVQSRLMHRLWKVADFGVETAEEDLDDAPSTKVSGKSGLIGLQGVVTDNIFAAEIQPIASGWNLANVPAAVSI